MVQIGRLNLLTPTRVTAASKEIKSGNIVPLNLPLNVPNVPAFGREVFQHEIKPISSEGVAYDDKYSLNTQSGTQWDGFRHIAHSSCSRFPFSLIEEVLISQSRTVPTKTFYNGTKAKDIEGPDKDDNKCGIHRWAEHGIAGRGILLDYWGYAKQKGIVYGNSPK